MHKKIIFLFLSFSGSLYTMDAHSTNEPKSENIADHPETGLKTFCAKNIAQQQQITVGYTLKRIKETSGKTVYKIVKRVACDSKNNESAQ